jgi:EAL domain-containing protein (putative c-di-GMP-specific phosphodiesterase class I)
LAEGVSQAGEAQVCKALGFDLLQGFYYHRPSTHLLSGTPDANVPDRHRDDETEKTVRPNSPDLEEEINQVNVD